MSEATSTSREYAGIGPVEAQVLELLRDWDGAHARFGTSIAQRSPVGPRAIRVWGKASPGDPAGPLGELVDWLGGQSWVAEVATRPQHVYVRVTTDALRAWVAAGLTGRGSDLLGDEGSRRTVAVRFVDCDSLPTPSLDQFREATVARAIGALLRSRGFEVMLEPVAPGERGPVAPDTVVVGTAPAPDRGTVVRLRVGEVDVRHGPLRARHGGSVGADDVIGELRGRLLRSEDPVAAQGSPVELLSLALLATERERRLQLDDDKLEREARAFEALAAMRRMVATGGAEALDEAGDGDGAIRELAGALDMLSNAAARATSALDATLITRFRRSVVDRAHAAQKYLPADDPLWPAVGEAIDVALGLAGLDAPRGERARDVSGGSGAGGVASVGGDDLPTDANVQALQGAA